MSKEAEEITGSHDVFLGEVTPASPTEMQLSQSIVNTRIVSKDELYTIEDVTVETVHTINSFYLNDGSGKRVKWGSETADLFSFPNGEELQKENITIGTLTSGHIKNPVFSDVSVKKDVMPIEPIEYTPPDGDTQRLYFAEVMTDTIAKITLRSESGDRQTVYKNSNSTSENMSTLERKLVDEVVRFEVDEDTVRLKKSSDSVSNSTEDKNKTGSVNQSIYSIIYDVVDRWGSVFILSALAVFLLAVNLLSIYFEFVISHGVTPGLVVASWLIITLVTWGLVQLAAVSTEENNNSEDGNRNNLSFYQDTGSIAIDLEEPDSLGGNPVIDNPITNVTVSPEFKNQTLVLTVSECDDPPICWEYQTNADNVFVNDEIIDFYTDLGFQNLERTSFEAYASTEHYDGEYTSLETRTGPHTIYLYPENPILN